MEKIMKYGHLCLWEGQPHASGCLLARLTLTMTQTGEMKQSAPFLMAAENVQSVMTHVWGGWRGEGHEWKRVSLLIGPAHPIELALPAHKHESLQTTS